MYGSRSAPQKSTIRNCEVRLVGMHRNIIDFVVSGGHFGGIGVRLGCTLAVLGCPWGLFWRSGSSPRRYFGRTKVSLKMSIARHVIYYCGTPSGSRFRHRDPRFDWPGRWDLALPRIKHIILMAPYSGPDPGCTIPP